MKKFLVLIACLLLAVFATGSVVSAADVKSDTTTVTYNPTSTYSLVIPASFTISSQSQAHLTVEVTDALINATEYINVTVYSTQFNRTANDGAGGIGLWQLRQQVGGDLYKLHYHIHDSSGKGFKNMSSVFKKSGTDFADAKLAGDFSLAEVLYLHLNESAPIGGLFTDYLVFTATVEP